MARRTYSDEEKAAGLAALALHGGDVSKAARGAGVPRRTLQRWRDETPETIAQIAQQKKDDLAALMDGIAYRAVGLIGRGFDAIENAVDDDGRPAVERAALTHLSELNRVMGTAIDKGRLVAGEVTERVEVQGASTDEAVEAMRRLRELRGKRKGA